MATVTSNLSSLIGLSLSDGVIVSHRMWQSEFGAKADVRGDPIRIDGIDTRVSGIAPDWLEGVYRDRAVNVWMPLPEEARKDLSSRNVRIVPSVAMAHRNHVQQRFAKFMGVAGRALCRGGRGSHRERRTSAPRVACETTQHHARR